MPDFWQFPTVSMGLAPINAIYQARFMRYLHHRSIANTEGRKVGDGEMDKPESPRALSLAARERLDNRISLSTAICNGSTGRYAATVGDQE